MPLVKGALMALLGPGWGQEEQTTTGNVGAYPVPLGPGCPLRQVFPHEPERKRRRRKKRLGVSAFGAPMLDVEEDELLARARHQLALLRS